jgi:hypothetical protein
MANLTFVQADLADGSILRVRGIRTFDGVSGWAVCAMRNGSTWAYAPMHHALLTGEIARELP